MLTLTLREPFDAEKSDCYFFSDISEPMSGHEVFQNDVSLAWSFKEACYRVHSTIFDT